MSNCKFCNLQYKEDRLTSILTALASNPDFLKTANFHYGNGKDPPSMREIVMALSAVEELWGH